MDYYTYQKQFPDNLNDFINHQYPNPPIIQTHITSTNEQYVAPINQHNTMPIQQYPTEYSIPTNAQYPTNNQPYTNISPNTELDYQYTVSKTSYPYHSCTIPPPQISNVPLASSVEIQTDDELWIESWLSEIGKTQINATSSTVDSVPSTEPINQLKKEIQIHSAKAILKNCFRVLDQLQQTQEYLKTNVTKMTTSEWNSKTMEIGIVKDHFSKLISQFERPEVITHLQFIVEKRRKKRLAHKRKKQNSKNCIAAKLESRQKLHKDIDCWLEAMKEEVERAKIEENMKKDADCVLSEVTKKKSDARKLLSLVTSLAKLRCVREQAAIQRGETVSLEDSIAFTKATNRLEKIWNDALIVYSKEEQGLRMMLEETAVEDKNAARIAKERKVTHEWDVVLFGPKRLPSPAYWGLMAAEKDLETFIAIRRSWDTFLTDAHDENGSSIPIGWVTPNPSPDQNWIKHLDSF